MAQAPPSFEWTGRRSSREFEIAAGATVSLSGLTMQNGRVPDPTAPFGGGIRNFGTLTLTNTVVSGNSTSGEGGGIHNDEGVLTIIGSTISSELRRERRRHHEHRGRRLDHEQHCIRQLRRRRAAGSRTPVR